MHNGDGRLLWSRSFDQPSMPTRLLPWRDYHDIQHSPEVLILRETMPGAFAAVLNAHTGEQLWRMSLDFGISRVVPLHAPLYEGSAVQSVYLLMAQADSVDAAPEVRLLPDSATSRKHVAASERSLHFFTYGQGHSTLIGYSLASRSNQDGQVSSRATWQVNFPGNILTITHRDPTEPIQSSVKVRGIRVSFFSTWPPCRPSW